MKTTEELSLSIDEARHHLKVAQALATSLYTDSKEPFAINKSARLLRNLERISRALLESAPVEGRE
jgi:hypothetical protein